MTQAPPESPANAPLRLPFRWTGWFRLPHAGPSLQNPLSWPAGGAPIVEVTPRQVDQLTLRSDAEIPDLIVAEVDGENELLSVAAAVRSGAMAALLFVSPRLASGLLSEAQALAPELALLPTGSGHNDAAAGRAIEELIRRRVYRLLLAHWRRELERHERDLIHHVPALQLPLPPRPTMAPLSTIDHAHVAGVVGLWWPTPTSATRSLGISAPTVRRLRSEVPDALGRALREATGEPLPESRRPLRLVIVEDDRDLAAATSRVLQLSAERRLGRELTVEITHSADECRQRFLDDGAPEILWVDMQLETPTAGLELVRWLRANRSPTVVLGKTARAPYEDIRELTRLGALSVWTPTRPREMHSLLADALRVSDEAAAIQRLELSVDNREDGLRRVVDEGMSALREVEQVRSLRRLVTGLEVDLDTILPTGTGRADSTLAEVRADAARLALSAAHGNVSEAARVLDVSSRRMLGLLHRTRAGGRRPEPDE